MLLAAWYHTIFAWLFALMAILLMMVILLQRGRGVGLSGAFGGTGGHTTFGAKTGDFLTWVTVIGAAVFMTAAIVLNYAFRPSTPAISTPAIQAEPAGGAADTPANAPPPAPAPPPTSAPQGTWRLPERLDRPALAQLPVFGEIAA